MRKPIIFFIFCIQSIVAQSGNFKKVDISYGDSAFTSGLNIALGFDLNNRKEFELVGNSQRFFGVLSYSLTPKLNIEASGGVFKQLPWVGPRLTYKPTKRLFLLYWGGVGTGRVGESSKSPKSFFQQGTSYLKLYKNISAGYTIIKFDVYRTNHLPEIVLSKKITKKATLRFSATYNVDDKKMLYMSAIEYRP